MVTGRDDVHHRIVHEGLVSPYDFKDMALLHAGPIVKEGAKENVMISIGPTSSIRMEADEAAFIEKTGVRIIIGKGGMGEKTAEACKIRRHSLCVSRRVCGYGRFTGRKNRDSVLA